MNSQSCSANDALSTKLVPGDSKIRAVLMSIEALTQAVYALHDSIDRLHSMLEPILYIGTFPKQESDTDKSVNAIESRPECEVSAKLNERVTRIYELNWKINRMIDSVQI